MLTLLLMVLQGCSAPKYGSGSSQSVTKLAKSVNLSDSKRVKAKLMSQYRMWKGTPYRYGGSSLKGVDCSAYVQNTFRGKLGYAMPRTTRTQIKVGRKVSKSSLKVGDVVFFKTGRNTLHNGIYLGQSKFMHASSSKGITISDLRNPYWKKTYFTAKRIR